jgi:cobalt-zinc-cadmium efflux system protein
MQQHRHGQSHEHGHGHEHEHGHGHEHEHGHGHEHEPSPGAHAGHAHDPAALLAGGLNARMALAVGLNLAFVAVEGCFGILSNSMALLADAGHNLSDVLGLVAAWAAEQIMRYQPLAPAGVAP